jgi:hypothetical protein
MWQVKEENEWKDVDGVEYQWHNGKLIVDWPDDSQRNVSFLSVEYPIFKVRQKPRGE